MDLDQAEAEAQIEEWVYLGPDPTGGYRWRDAEGRQMAYGKVKARIFGGIYTLKVRRSEDNISAYPHSLEWTGRHCDDAAQVQVHAIEQERQVKLKRLSASASRTAALDEAIAPLLEIVRGFKTYSDRAALVDYVSAKVHGR